ncbi:MAG: hypothetical protein ABR992_05050 [Solirubrobacteraceae bacterium]
MSGASLPSEESLPLSERRWERLPAWLRPRMSEQRGSGRLWRVETTVLVVVGLFLAVAIVNDLARQTRINHRLVADLTTWRHYTHHDYKNISIDQETLGANNDREVLCGNTSGGAPGSTTQICLAIWGPTVNGTRTVHGGWYLPPYYEDVRSKRYGCFGVVRELCPR